MRIHSLSVTAFGPFAGTVGVDFDDLSEAGLFLLTGPTGAGKSSVLDAVCFALYGQVPGDRQSARQLRCDRARPGSAPEVVLECSIRGRRFRFTRSPQWDRPKKRGTGSTRVQSHVVVEEHRDGAWEGLTNRLDDAGLLVTDLLGMTCSQFTQVALLPQGRFMTFLRSRSEERQRVLQALFRTDRFEQVERWLVDRRIELRRASQGANDRVAAVLNRLQEAAGSAVPAGWELADLALPATDGEVVAWAREVQAAARDEAEQADVRRGQAVQAAKASTTALQQAEQLAALQRRGREATDLDARLASTADRAAADTERLARHQRALPVSRLAAGAQRTRREAERATRQAREALGAAASVLEAVTDEPGLFPAEPDLVVAEERATAALAVAVAFRPRHTELEQLGRRCSALADQRLALAAEADAVQQQLDSAPERLDQAETAVRAARTAEAALPVATTTLSDAEAVLAAVDELRVVMADLSSLESETRGAQDRAQQLRQHWLDLREARVQGMAAELAGQLAVGCACPVCGSAQHPAPAAAGVDAVGQAEEDLAHRAYEDAAFDLQLLAEKAAELRTRRAGLEDRARGLDTTAAAAAVEEARALLTRLRTQAAGLETAEATLARLQHEVHEARRRRQGLEGQLSGIRVAHQAASDQVEQLTAELAELLAGTAAESLDDLVAAHERARSVLVRARTARQAEEVARSAAAAATEAALDAATQAGFDSVDEATAACLDDTEADDLRARLEERSRQAQHAAALLADEAVRAALPLPSPDVPALRVDAESAQADRDRAAAASDASRRRLRRVDSLTADLETALADWQPVRDEHATVGSLAALVEGKGPDNPLRMRLSAYVLGERLRQVVAAANERLDRMSGSRYVLEQSDSRGAGEVRGGLSLLVRDAWSGQARDPATLSGGETFIVSLALALGLADTVSHEAGGVGVDTLFIDEGFGSLDADTLDDVMDTLDGLREGGRVVGLVSHVPELRTRIPTQLEVTTTRTGSQVRAQVTTG